MTQAEALALIDDELPEANGDRMDAALKLNWGMAAQELMMRMERDTGRILTRREMDALTSEAAVLSWLTMEAAVK